MDQMHAMHESYAGFYVREDVEKCPYACHRGIIVWAGINWLLALCSSHCKPSSSAPCGICALQMRLSLSLIVHP